MEEVLQCNMDLYYLIKFFVLMCASTVTVCMSPEFDMPEVNVTVKEFETAILPCSVKFLGTHQVVWTDQFSTLLSYQDRRIIDDERLSIERPFTKDWNLHIRKVKHSDQGTYHCQLNTVPVKAKTVNLRVEVPAKIIEHLSTQDVTVQENDQVTLVCNVTGVPTPDVTWYRHVSGQRGVEKQKVGVNGEVLVIHNVTRYCGDIYECVAFNGVPPAVNHLIKVEVQFAPEIYLHNKRIGQDEGKETILECTVTAFPHAQAVWTRNGNEIRTLSQKYRLEIYDEDRHTITLSLRMFSIERHDFGTYTCIASNKLGEDSESMILYEYSAHIPTTTTTTPITTTTTTSLLSRNTDASVLRPPYLEPDTPNSIFPRVEGRGHNSKPINTYRPITYPDPRILQQSGEGGSNGKVLQSNMGSGGVSGVASLHCSSIFSVVILCACVLL
ncbi:opioid-binding protein/cell adhesion molecule homolog isoform X2 [Littorina saxatilis]|uniref:opioid-binding protein/cell adhesion molecule homolog isoform X2 n=1 Tax=Littorina saxatilis TaxID=31220 RepID=UPI0038B4E31B